MCLQFLCSMTINMSVPSCYRKQTLKNKDTYSRLIPNPFNSFLLSFGIEIKLDQNKYNLTRMCLECGRKDYACQRSNQTTHQRSKWPIKQCRHQPLSLPLKSPKSVWWVSVEELWACREYWPCNVTALCPWDCICVCGEHILSGGHWQFLHVQILRCEII